MSERISVTRAMPEHWAALAAFFREVWDPGATAEGVGRARAESAAANQAWPGEDVPTFIVLQGARVVAHVSSIPIRLWNGSRELPAHWVKGLMVLPEFRNGPLGFMVLKEATRQLPRAVVLTVAPASKRLFAALGYADLGALPNHLRLLRPARVLASLDLHALGLGGLPRWAPGLVEAAQRTGLARLGGGILGASLRGGAALLRLPARGNGVETLSFATGGSVLDALWKSAAPRLGAGVVRDARYLAWRYRARSAGGGPYHASVVSYRDVPSGVLVLREPSGGPDPRLHGVRVSTIADLLFRPGDSRAGLALLGQAERLARQQDADAILCSSAHANLTQLLRRQGYIPLPGNVHFFVRDVTGELPALPGRLSEWWLTRGDGESDEAF